LGLPPDEGKSSKAFKEIISYFLSLAIGFLLCHCERSAAILSFRLLRHPECFQDDEAMTLLLLFIIF